MIQELGPPHRNHWWAHYISFRMCIFADASTECNEILHCYCTGIATYSAYSATKELSQKIQLLFIATSLSNWMSTRSQSSQPSSANHWNPIISYFMKCSKILGILDEQVTGTILCLLFILICILCLIQISYNPNAGLLLGALVKSIVNSQRAVDIQFTTKLWYPS